MLSFDHVIVAVRDLDVAADRLFEEYGLASVSGGRHSGLGTGNRIVPMGRDYVELMAIVDPDEAAAGPLGPFLTRLTEEGDGLAALCLQTDDIEGIAEQRGLQPLPMKRTTPAGAEVSWRLAGLERTLADQSYPFFIQWDVPAEMHPGAMQVGHGIEPHGIEWVEVAGDRGELAAWLGRHGLDIRVVDGPPGVVAVGVGTDAGEVVLS